MSLCRDIAAALLLALAAGCAGSARGVAPDRGAFAWPSAVAVDPAGDFVYVVSSNFDSAFSGGTVVPVSVAGIDEVIAEARASGATGLVTVPLTDPRLASAGAAIIGSFGGEIAMLRSGDLTFGFVAVRDGDRLQWFSVERGPEGPTLVCATGESDEPRCDATHSVPLEWDDPSERYGNVPGTDPYAVAVGAGLEQGSPIIYAGTIRGGSLVVLAPGPDGKPEVLTAVPIGSGIHSIAEGPLVGGRRVVYVSSRFRNEIHVIEVRRVEGGGTLAEPRQPVIIAQVSSTGDYWRGLAMSADGRRLYAALRSPNALAVFDIDPETGDPALRGLVALFGAPASLAVVPGPTPGQDTVYVTDFSHDGLYAVDTLSMSVLDRIPVGDGPYGVAIASRPDGTGRRAFIPLFEEDALSVVDIEPGSPTYHTELARVR